MSVLALVLATASAAPQLNAAHSNACKVSTTFSTLGMVTTAVVTTGMVAPMLIAPNTEVGPVIALGTAVTASPMWVVSGIGALASARRCGRPDAWIAGIGYLTVGLSVPLAFGSLGLGFAAGGFGGVIVGGGMAFALGAAGVPMLVVATVASSRLLVLPMAEGKPGLTVAGRF